MEATSPDETLRCPVSDDDPTERFTLQRCPSCEGVTAVPLFLATSHCEICLYELEVAPLHA
jgi:hypothetical protein